jgi:iron(III) transport system substrate-binding protein
MYGTNIRVNHTPGPSMPDMAAKLTQELIAGQRASSDIMLGSEGHFFDLLKQDVLEEYDYARLSPRITRDLLAERNIGVEIYSTVNVIAYNTSLVSAAESPRNLEDVLNEKWRGKIASTPYASGFERAGMRSNWGPERMKTFVSRLTDYVGGLIRMTEVPRVAAGEFHVMVFGDAQTARAMRARGAPLAYVVPEDAAAAGVMHMGVPRHAVHPNLAKLFVNAMVSTAGQEALFLTGGADHYAMPGSQSAADLADLKAKGVTPLEIDVQFLVRHPEIEELQQELARILTQKR